MSLPARDYPLDILRSDARDCCRVRTPTATQRRATHHCRQPLRPLLPPADAPLQRAAYHKVLCREAWSYAQISCRSHQASYVPTNYGVDTRGDTHRGEAPATHHDTHHTADCRPAQLFEPLGIHTVFQATYGHHTQTRRATYGKYKVG